MSKKNESTTEVLVDKAVASLSGISAVEGIVGGVLDIFLPSDKGKSSDLISSSLDLDTNTDKD